MRKKSLFKWSRFTKIKLKKIKTFQTHHIFGAITPRQILPNDFFFFVFIISIHSVITRYEGSHCAIYCWLKVIVLGMVLRRWRTPCSLNAELHLRCARTLNKCNVCCQTDDCIADDSKRRADARDVRVTAMTFEPTGSIITANRSTLIPTAQRTVFFFISSAAVSSVHPSSTTATGYVDGRILYETRTRAP